MTLDIFGTMITIAIIAFGIISINTQDNKAIKTIEKNNQDK